jgi:hypothetical protein
MRILIKETSSEKLRELIKTIGLTEVIKLVGGINTLMKVAFNNDLKEYYKSTGYVPYKFDAWKENMYIDEMLVQSLNLKNDWSGKEKVLGDFRFGPKNGMDFKFTAYLTDPRTLGGGSNSNQMFRRVIGTCGDSGFGYSHITKRNTLGKRARTQIFKQIIEKYNLNSFL